MGDAPGAFSTQCGGGLDALNSDCWGGIWPLSYFVTPKAPVVAPPGVPQGALLTTPPASGEQAQQTVDELVNQQMVDQQALNAGNVQSSSLDLAAGGLYQAGEAVGSAASSAASSLTSPWLWLGIGLAGFALIAIGGGSSRRYGR